MSKAQEAALKAFPGQAFIHDRCVFKFGYEQAEKDLALTWRDISHLEIILADMVDEDVAGKLPDMGDAEYYTEALKRFNEWRKENDKD